MTADDHGARTTYVHYGCRCEACAGANAEYQRRSQAARIARLPATPVAHGSVSTYTNWGCRCDDCRRANSAACADRRRHRMHAADAAHTDSPGAPAGVGVADAGAAANPHGGAGRTDRLPGDPPARQPVTQTTKLGPSLTAGSAGVRLDPRPAAGADVTGAVTVRREGKALGPAAHAGTEGATSATALTSGSGRKPHRAPTTRQTEVRAASAGLAGHHQACSATRPEAKTDTRSHHAASPSTRT